MKENSAFIAKLRENYHTRLKAWPVSTMTPAAAYNLFVEAVFDSVAELTVEEVFGKEEKT